MNRYYRLLIHYRRRDKSLGSDGEPVEITLTRPDGGDSIDTSMAYCSYDMVFSQALAILQSVIRSHLERRSQYVRVISVTENIGTDEAKFIFYLEETK